MSGLVKSIRNLVEEYSAVFGASAEVMLLEAYYGTLILGAVFCASMLVLMVFGK